MACLLRRLLGRKKKSSYASFLHGCVECFLVFFFSFLIFSCYCLVNSHREKGGFEGSQLLLSDTRVFFFPSFETR